MDDLEYSTEAKNVLSDFHEVDLMFYVEGDDDVPFWEFMLGKFSNMQFKVESVGGKDNFKKYLDDIYSNEINSVVGMDMDYSFFDNKKSHPKIIKTYGYSIENTIISIEVIFDVIRALGRLPRKDINIDLINDWLNAFKESISSLVLLDIESCVGKHGCDVLGASCHRFLRGGKSPELCHKKIETHLKGVPLSIPPAKSTTISRKINKFGRTIFDVVRGHFLFSWALNMVTYYIKTYREKLHLSVESFFGSLLISFEKNFKETHEHYNYYRDSISTLSA